MTIEQNILVRAIYSVCDCECCWNFEKFDDFPFFLAQTTLFYIIAVIFQ